MDTLDRETIRLWIRRMAILTALSVGVLSWLSGVSALFLTIRGGLGFVVIYALGMGGLVLFEQGGVPEIPNTRPEKGSRIDIAVGELAAAGSEEEAFLAGAEPDVPGGPASGPAQMSNGQPDPDLRQRVMSGADSGQGLSSSLGRPEGLPGQVKPGLQKGLPDSATQADIVRRMGWENLSDS